MLFSLAAQLYECILCWLNWIIDSINRQSENIHKFYLNVISTDKVIHNQHDKRQKVKRVIPTIAWNYANNFTLYSMCMEMSKHSENVHCTVLIQLPVSSVLVGIWKMTYLYRINLIKKKNSLSNIWHHSVKNMRSKKQLRQ